MIVYGRMTQIFKVTSSMVVPKFKLKVTSQSGDLQDLEASVMYFPILHYDLFK